MERIFEAQNAGYGQMVLGFASATKAKVSTVLTTLKLPKPLVTVMTWAILISLGLMLAGLIAFVALIYFALTSKSGAASESLQEKNLKDTDAGWLGPEMDLDHWNDPTLSWHYTRNGEK